jgi:hypothetical protein
LRQLTTDGLIDRLLRYFIETLATASRTNSSQKPYIAEREAAPLAARSCTSAALRRNELDRCDVDKATWRVG